MTAATDHIGKGFPLSGPGGNAHAQHMKALPIAEQSCADIAGNRFHRLPTLMTSPQAVPSAWKKPALPEGGGRQGRSADQAADKEVRGLPARGKPVLGATDPAEPGVREKTPVTECSRYFPMSLK